MGYKSILVISDQHFPYQHPDTIDFLKTVKTKYKPDKVVNIGDEVDYHSMSFHPSDEDLFSAGDELKKAIDGLKPLYKMFPEMDLVESNHGSMVYRKAKFHGMPMDVFKSYREILKAPKGWRWHFDLVLEMSDGNKVYFCHGKSSAHSKLSQTMGMSTVQGHFHEKFYIDYWANPNGLYWQMQVGCLVNDKSMAFNYNNTNLKRPIVGTGIILDGHPRLLPMVLDKHGRWTGKLV